MRKYTNRIKRIKQQLEDSGRSHKAGYITRQAELIRMYLTDEITADEFSKRSEVEHAESTPAQQQYRDDIFEKYLHSEQAKKH